MCREATLAWQTIDVVVINDSPHGITVSTFYTDSAVTVSFVSVPWAEVDSWIGAPFDVEGVGGAFSVTCGRTTTHPDGTSASEDPLLALRLGFPRLSLERR